jgi:hypothetical protein
MPPTKKQTGPRLRSRRKLTSASISQSLFRILKEEPDQFSRKLLFIGYLFDQLRRRGVEAYLVGGEAVELYTAGQFETGDVDITVTSREKAERILSRMGFSREGMIWLNEDLAIAVQIVASHPTRTEKVRSIKAKGFTIRMAGVEDLIVDRLVAAKYWRSNPKLDSEQASVLMNLYRNDIDREYLKKRASEENVEDYLQQIPEMSTE